MEKNQFTPLRDEELLSVNGGGALDGVLGLIGLALAPGGTLANLAGSVGNNLTVITGSLGNSLTLLSGGIAGGLLNLTRGL